MASQPRKCYFKTVKMWITSMSNSASTCAPCHLMCIENNCLVICFLTTLLSSGVHWKYLPCGLFLDYANLGCQYLHESMYATAAPVQYHYGITILVVFTRTSEAAGSSGIQGWVLRSNTCAHTHTHTHTHIRTYMHTHTHTHTHMRVPLPSHFFLWSQTATEVIWFE